MKEPSSGAAYCSVVPKKGTSHKGVVQKIVEWIDEFGFEKIIVKSDNEPSILQVQNEITEKRKGTTTIPENSPAGEGKSNGLAENAVKELEGWIRTSKLHIQNRSGVEINADSPIDHDMDCQTCRHYPIASKGEEIDGTHCVRDHQGQAELRATGTSGRVNLLHAFEDREREGRDHKLG